MATKEERIAELTARLGVLELPTEKELLAEILAELRPDNRSEFQKAKDALQAHVDATAEAEDDDVSEFLGFPKPELSNWQPGQDASWDLDKPPIDD